VQSVHDVEVSLGGFDSVARHATFLDLAQLAAAGVRGCAGAGVTMLVDGAWTTVAATSTTVRDVDSAQYRRDDGPCLTAVRTATPVSVNDFAVDLRWSGVANEACAVGVRSSLSVPLHDGDQVVGGLNLYGLEPGAFSDEDEQAALLIGRQGGLALHYLRMLDAERIERAAEHRIAETLQRSLLPELPSIDGLPCAARFAPGSHEAQVGGDWYDLFQLPDGAVGLVIGDVMGHDVAAAAAMGQLRSVLRSYAYEGFGPATVLDRLDALVQRFDMVQLATVFYARLVLDRDGALMLYANAGHPAPLLRLPDGEVSQLAGAASPLIGAPVRAPGSRSEAAVSVPTGSTLLLYTDGLVEGHHQALEDGQRRLTDALARRPPDDDLDQLCEGLMAELSQPAHDDDVALLVARVSPTAAPLNLRR
jgi:serine phosphatase RsbU (regulator of sigma subunit)